MAGAAHQDNAIRDAEEKLLNQVIAFPVRLQILSLEESVRSILHGVDSSLRNAHLFEARSDECRLHGVSSVAIGRADAIKHQGAPFEEAWIRKAVEA
ncbi:hypothetical protein O9K51_02723 [Purpureocillium lavendulum]|uniref:Uncharacterized protein n=1 Tax=Purpureocillium lavendulum TaxID=1247861 RepID=A0AB34FZ02_9HYPO|nr:hypothetical protein O9K51_02723 [Purpureocillium lavendulum]